MHSTATQTVLSSLPDLIRDVVLELEVSLDNPQLSSTQDSQSSTTFIQPDLQQAFQTGDYAKIEAINDKASSDMDPIYGNIRQNEDKAWIQIINSSNNTPYWISLAGDHAKPTGYMWVYTDPKAPRAKVGDDPGFQHVVQVGTLSRNTKYMGISTSIWDNKALNVTAGAISTIVTTVTTRYITARIAGTPFAEALVAAVTRAGQVLISRGVVTAAGWVAGAALTAKFIGGAVLSTALYFLIMFIADFVYREYKCCINIYNWTPDKSFTVKSFFGSNEKIDDNQDFVAAALGPASQEVVLPDGFSAQTTGSAVVQYATYTFINVNKLLEGLTVAMEVAGNVLRFKYGLYRFKDNRLGLAGNSVGTLAQWLNDQNTWAAAGSYGTSSKLADGTPIMCTTTGLGGRSDQFYQLDIHIGLPPKGSFADHPKEPLRRDLREYPEEQKMLKVGDTIGMPDGTTEKVVGDFHNNFVL